VTAAPEATMMKRKVKKKPTLKRRVRQLERRADDEDVLIWRILGDVEDQSKRIQSVEDHQWWTENPF
jgi:ribosomal protein L18E